MDNNKQKIWPKRKECHGKPKMIISQMGYGDRDNQYSFHCRTCGLKTNGTHDNEFNCLLEWNNLVDKLYGQ